MSGATVLGLVAGFCTTFCFLPQVIRCWRTRSTKDISLGMLVVLCIGIVLWVVYAVMITDLPLMLANGVTLILAANILYFKLRHG